MLIYFIRYFYKVCVCLCICMLCCKCVYVCVMCYIYIIMNSWHIAISFSSRYQLRSYNFRHPSLKCQLQHQSQADDHYNTRDAILDKFSRIKKKRRKISIFYSDFLMNDWKLFHLIKFHVQFVCEEYMYCTFPLIVFSLLVLPRTRFLSSPPGDVHHHNHNHHNQGLVMSEQGDNWPRVK